MKILELRFKNLNSLQGEWRIDFTNPEYETNGIFALTGPTGAGKSTILDAICLALYGETPRLGKITKGENEIMSRHTGECYAEVVFQSQAGIYRCHWEQRKARKSPDGALQDQEHQIAEAESGKIIESKKSKVVAVIEEKTGMDFKRFNRSILLAQGSFDSFLKADVGHKSEILEQMTGTEIYSEISQQVHVRKSHEHKQLEILQAEIGGIELLSADQITELTAQLAQQKQINTELQGKIETVRAAIDWLKQMNVLEQTLAEIKVDQIALNESIEAFSPKKNQITLAMKAAAIESKYVVLDGERKQQRKDQSALSLENEQLPMIQAELTAQQSLCQKLSEQNEALITKHEAQKSIWKEVRKIDVSLAEKQRGLAELQNICDELTKEIALNNTEITAQHSAMKAHNEALVNAQNYLQEHSADEWLVRNLVAIQSQLLQWQTQATAIQSKSDTLIKEQKKSDQLQAVIENAKKELDAQTAKQATKAQDHQLLKTELETLLAGRLLREYRADKDAALREQTLLNRIASYEDARLQLQDGKACPLCGSEDHPFAKGNLPEQTEIELKIEELTAFINKIEDTEHKIQQSDKEIAEIDLLVAKFSSAHEKAQQDHASAMLLLLEKQAELAEVIKNYQQAKVEIEQDLQKLSVELNEDVNVTIAQLKARLDEWQAQQTLSQTIQKTLNDNKGETQRLQAIVETKQSTLTAQQIKLPELAQECSTLSSERIVLFGEQNVDAAEKSMNDELRNLNHQLKSAEAERIKQQQAVGLLTQKIEQLNQNISERNERLIEKEAEFKSQLTAQSFEDETAFLSALLEVEILADLQAEAQQLEQRSIDLNAREKDRQEQLIKMRAQQLTDQTMEDLSPTYESWNEQLLAQQTAANQIEFQLTENSKALSRIAEKKEAIDAQRLECQRWDKLHGLIGSADGKKYRNFAQGLTFELMVNHANRQLEKMTDRYLLMRDDKEPLKLNVIDNYQAGEVRSTKNLSGGESFIISLALALGLSKMASRKVRVDSLFLDEGFGTLDEEALDTALATLSNLHGEGKLIGVISHVSALKERIATQIRVKPMNGGKSEILGPGCEKICNIS